MIKSPYRRGADDGLIFGIYLTVMFFASLAAASVPLLGILSLVMMVAVPLVIYRFLLNYHRLLGRGGTFAMLWMHGVVIFFCGMLIAGLALVIYMKWICPDFIIDQLRAIVALKGTLPGSGIDEAAEIAERMIEARVIPTPMDIVGEMMMLAIVTGSFLSITLSAFFSLRRRREHGPVSSPDDASQL